MFVFRNSGRTSRITHSQPARAGIPWIVFVGSTTEPDVFGVVDFIDEGEKWRCLAMSDSILILRCPYCTAGTDFVPLRAYKDGRFVCDECAHTVRPGESGYRCICRNCIKWKREERP
jgi:hypothetical protein